MQFTKEALAYIDSQPDEYQAFYKKLQDLIEELYPDAMVKLNYGIALYYKGKNWVGLGFRKDGISLYTQFPALINTFKTKHSQYKTGKACLNFKLKDIIPQESIKEVIRGAMNPNS
jgi:uncharacterized protein YdhG (YjbR/CyaY superfamily)